MDYQKADLTTVISAASNIAADAKSAFGNLIPCLATKRHRKATSSDRYSFVRFCG